MISRRHVLHAGYDVKVTGDTFKAAAKYVQWMCLSDFNLITSAGSLATQTIGHLHVHIVPRRPGDGLHLPWTVS